MKFFNLNWLADFVQDVENKLSKRKEDKMFDTKKVGAKIAALRKQKDMTQMELSDKMLVSYQAVSNWERGNTMPDISKLAELSNILGVSIEELLGSEKEARVVDKVVNHAEDVKMEEVASVAPLLKPSQVEDYAEKASEEPLDFSILVEMAPFLSSERLMAMAKQVKNLGMERLVVLAPFLESEQLSALISEHPEWKGNIGAILPLAPFLDEEALDKLVMQAMEGEVDGSSLVMLAPFLEETTLDALAGKLKGKGNAETIIGLAPFMSEAGLKNIAADLMKQGDIKLLRGLLPFLDLD